MKTGSTDSRESFCAFQRKQRTLPEAKSSHLLLGSVVLRQLHFGIVHHDTQDLPLNLFDL